MGPVFLGVSPLTTRQPGLYSTVRDLETVVHSAGLEKFDLLGFSQGGAVSIAYAARHLERVSHLILGEQMQEGARTGISTRSNSKRWRRWLLS